MSFIGQPVKRIEDDRLLRGAGRYSDDHTGPGQAHLSILRSPHAHARLLKIDTTKAKAAPGVLLVVTGADYVTEGLKTPDTHPPVLGPVSRVKTGIFSPPNEILPVDRVRYVGEAVAFVAAETKAQAQDALALIDIEYGPLTPLIDLRDAVHPGAPLIWDDIPGNLCCELEIGDARACDDAFARAAHVSSIEVVNNRIIGMPMEPRASVGEFDAATGHMTLTCGAQTPNTLRDILAEQVFRVPQAKVRVISPDMGGGFGTRQQCFAEYVFVLWSARKLQRPVRYLGDRSEMFLSDSHGRDNISQASIALDRDGHILGLRVNTLADLGAYPGYAGPLVPVSAGPRVQTGCYRVPAVDIQIQVVFTNTMTVSPYRGAGQPEAIHLIERLMDVTAAEMKIDRIELRRRNLLRREEFPLRTAAGALYDSGDYADAMARVMRNADWPGFAARRLDSERNGKHRGLGFANYVQVSGSGPFEWGGLVVRPEGFVELRAGTHSHGQGHETSYAQILAETLGIPLEQVSFVQGDTDRVAKGTGTFASRSLFKMGQIIEDGCALLLAKAKKIAAHSFDVAEDRLVYDCGELRVPGTNFGASLFDLSAYAAVNRALPQDLQGTLSVTVDHNLNTQNFPSGSHVCEVEVDPETGHVTLLRYTAVDDAGRLINPLIAGGQMHGGIVQGIGQALCERIVYDDKSGQLLTGSLMDYALPMAADMPAVDVTFQEVPSPTNPLGVKGIGESGPTGAPPAVISAIVDALSKYGVRHIEMPATPEKVWRAIQAAR